jgi:tetratricopeptide (TPR) repeat protein
MQATGMSIRKLAAAVSAAGKILAGIMGVVLLLWLLCRVVAGFHNDSVRVRPFEVAKSFAESGLTGETLAERFKEKLAVIAREVKAWKARGGKNELAPIEIREEDEVLGEVKVPGSDSSLEELSDLFLTALQRPPIEVKGTLVAAPQETIGSIKTSGHPPRIFQMATPRGCDVHCVDALVSDAAEAFYYERRPCGLELYYHIMSRPECEIAARRCAKSNPVFAYNIWALFEMHRGNLHTAASRLRQALALASEEPMRWQLEAFIYNNWGNVLSRAGDDRGAIKKYDAAILADSSSASAYFNRGLAKEKLSDKKAAAAMYDKAIDADPSLPQPYINRAVLLRSQGEIKKAVALLTRARENVPGNADILYHLAWSLKQAGDDDASLAAYEGMIDLNPRDLRGYRGAAEVLQGCHRFRAAGEELRRGVPFAFPEDQAKLRMQLVELGRLEKTEGAALQVATCKAD